jgi:hypothetical protein
MGADSFSVRWIGQVEPLYSETYTFYTNTDDGVRLWVDGQLIVDHWVDQSPTEWSGTIALSAGIQYDIEMEYYENGGGAVAELRWSSASQAKEIIPQGQLYPGELPPPTVAFDLVSSGGDESVTPVSLSVSLSEASASTVYVDYAVTGGDATGGGVDYTLAAGTLTFDPYDVSETIDISIVDDGLVESDETIEVTLSNPSNATLGANTVHTYTILDNDAAGVPETLFFDDFESGSFTAGGWTTTGSPSVSTSADYNGIYGARLRSTSSITKALSTVGYSEIHVTFYRRTQGLDSNEYLYCEWSDDGGQNWYLLGSTRSTSWAQEDFTCPSGADNNPDFRFRYRLNASSTREYGYVDDVEIIGTP